MRRTRYNYTQPSPVLPVDFKRKRLCRQMPASIFTHVQTAVRLLSPKKEIAVCFVHTALLNVRQSRRMGNASVFDSSLTLPRSISPSLLLYVCVNACWCDYLKMVVFLPGCSALKWEAMTGRKSKTQHLSVSQQ